MLVIALWGQCSQKSIRAILCLIRSIRQICFVGPERFADEACSRAGAILCGFVLGEFVVFLPLLLLLGGDGVVALLSPRRTLLSIAPERTNSWSDSRICLKSRKTRSIANLCTGVEIVRASLCNAIVRVCCNKQFDATAGRRGGKVDRVAVFCTTSC